jgi:cytochrome P450
VQEFALHYPFQIIYRQLAMSDEQAPIFHKLAVAQLLASIGTPQGAEATLKLGAFFQRLVEIRRANPGPDLVSHLAHVQVEGEYLHDEVLVSFLRQLINAGGDTTFRGTTVLLAGLLSNPDQLAALYADRSLIPRAIEEALRWEGPVLATQRATLTDTELCGVQIPAGAFLSVVLGSASRDPAKYKHPDRFDIFRDARVRNLAFASGPHVCIGQHLARLEMTRALNALLDALPNLRLDPSREPPEIRGHHLRSPEHIYVRFDA